MTNQNELWIFIQIDWIVRLPDPSASPRVYTIAHEQHVLIKDSDGWKAPVKINPGFTRTINPNLSHIVRSEDQFYLISSSKQGDLPNIFIWDQDKFDQLPIGSSTNITKRIGYKEDTSVPANEAIINAETERSGWRVAYLERDPFFFWGDTHFDFTNLSTTDVKFSWKGKQYAIKGYNRSSPGLLQLVELGDEGESHDLVQFDSKETHINNYTYRQILRQKQEQK